MDAIAFRFSTESRAARALPPRWPSVRAASLIPTDSLCLALSIMASAALAALLFERFGPWTACFYYSAVLAVVAAGLIFGLKLTAAPIKAPWPCRRRPSSQRAARLRE
jgi:hypothetical protein